MSSTSAAGPVPSVEIPSRASLRALSDVERTHLLSAHGVVPEFYPTLEQMHDFSTYMQSIEHLVWPCGLCKIVPPTEWRTQKGGQTGQSERRPSWFVSNSSASSGSSSVPTLPQSSSTSNQTPAMSVSTLSDSAAASSSVTLSDDPYEAKARALDAQLLRAKNDREVLERERDLWRTAVILGSAPVSSGGSSSSSVSDQADSSVAPPLGVVQCPDFCSRPASIFRYDQVMSMMIPSPICQNVYGSNGAYQVLHEAKKTVRVDVFQRSAQQQGSDIPELIARCLTPTEPRATTSPALSSQPTSTSTGGTAAPSDSGANAPRSSRSDRSSALRAPDSGNVDLDRLVSALNTVEYRFWSSLAFASPTYGADMLGSLFDERITTNAFNVKHLNTILDVLGNAVSGVTTPYLYFGMWKAMFPFHTEDMNLFSVNYLHFGHPKFWYAIPPASGHKFEELAGRLFPDKQKECSEFLRHKTTLLSPDLLQQNSIPYFRTLQKEGDFMVTFPFSYHAGFNCGFNCAEAVNFALESWIPWGKKALACSCRLDSVRINMSAFDQLLALTRSGVLPLRRCSDLPNHNSAAMTSARRRVDRIARMVEKETQPVSNHVSSPSGVAAKRRMSMMESDDDDDEWNEPKHSSRDGESRSDRKKRKELRRAKRDKKKNSEKRKATSQGSSERKKPKSQVILPDVAPDGSLSAPLQLGATLQVVALGRISTRPGFHSARYLYPIGFTSIREFSSFKTPSEKLSYRNEILEGRDGSPLFRVTPLFPEGDGESFDSKTSSGAWSSLLKELRANDPTSRKFVAVSGPVMFGFSDRIVLALLSQLPDADRCTKFQPSS
eukprot:CAMPEP_0177646294 /NCGR_PEP_ID=MMETSP0447-20121125/9699_1 /TAXON_ID=0 /ORGANISM="Stygamoeba regulata, Strain BSH-02190019" /LENGTH=834 /DNA_ID=CAMNT_0019148821 /DNA_START=104 /DNA_END=2608 /DNA_ORIENTATION=-